MPIVTVELGETPFFIPPHTRGDREFNGHGPYVYVRVLLRVANSTEIWAHVYMRATETKADWTTAEGESQPYRVYVSPQPIQYIVGRTVGEHFYMDDDHAPDVFEFPVDQNIMRRVECIGDTKGDEAGTSTGVRIAFHPIGVMI